jgi:hypothetical protein
MIDEIVPNGRLHVAASVQVAGSGARAKQASQLPMAFGLTECPASRWRRHRLRHSHAVPPDIDEILTQFTSNGWGPTVAQRLACLTHWHTSKRFLADYFFAPNDLPEIFRPTPNEFKRAHNFPHSWSTALLPIGALGLLFSQYSKMINLRKNYY